LEYILKMRLVGDDFKKPVLGFTSLIGGELQVFIRVGMDLMRRLFTIKGLSEGMKVVSQIVVRLAQDVPGVAVGSLGCC